MQFAVAWVAADALEVGMKLPEIYIDSYDPNKPMITLGKKLWHQYELEIRKYPSMKVLSDAIKNIKPRASTAETIHIGGEIQGQSWISAIHAIYPHNWDKVKSHIDQVKSRTTYDAGMITSLSMREELFDRVSPPTPGSQYRYIDCEITLNFMQRPLPVPLALSETTRLRKELHSQIHDLDNTFQYIGKDIIWYLDRDVTWCCPNSLLRIYIEPG